MIHVAIEPDRLVVGERADLAVRLTNPDTTPCRNIVFKLRVPPSIVLMGGDRIELDELGAGRTATRTIQVRPKTVGVWTVPSVNFSYRDDNGMTHRDNFTMDVTVVAATAVPTEPEPVFTVEFLGPRLTHGEWTEASFRMVNTGPSALHHPAVDLAGPIDVRRDQHHVDVLAPGDRADFSFFVHPQARGSKVPIRVVTSYEDADGHRRSRSRTLAVQVIGQGMDEAESGGNRIRGDVVRVLYLAANPTDTTRVLWDRELREIEDSIRGGGFRDRIVLRSAVATRKRDMSQALIETRPRVVHFSGHGSDGRLFLENDQGRTQLMSPVALTELLAATTDSVECVIVNACDTVEMARALATDIDYVIGMRRSLNDRAAIDFSIGFYQALAGQLPIDRAFKTGRALVEGDETETKAPVLFPRMER
jgi:hypothetical protein